MKVRLLWFARVRQIVGAETTEWQLPSGATVGDLRRELTRRFPELAEFLPRCAMAVDAQYATDAAALRDGSEVACIPPVSGG